MTGVLTGTVTGPEYFLIPQIGGNPWDFFGRRAWKGLTPPSTHIGTGEATGRRLAAQQGLPQSHKKFKIWTIGGNPSEILVAWY